MTGTSDLIKIDVMFDGSNYAVWSRDVKDTLGFLKHEGALLDANHAAKNQALCIIRKSVDPTLRHYLDACVDAKSAWEKVAEIAKTYAVANGPEMKRDLSNIRKKPGESIQQYVSRGRSMQSSLKSMGIEVEDEDLVEYLSLGLPKAYEGVLDALSDKMAKISIIEFEAKLRQKEKRIESDTSEVSNVSLLAGKGKSQIKCEECGKVGHLESDCWQKNPCTYCGKKGHIEKFCLKKKREMKGFSEAAFLPLL